MALVINTNLASINTQRNLTASQKSLSTALQQLSSGFRINSAKDDAAGLAVASRMDSLVRGMAVAQRNANDGISMYQTAESAVGNIGDALTRMRELAVQSANGTLGSADRANIGQEFSQLQAEITRVISGTAFNGLKLLDTIASTYVSSVNFQIGAEASGANVITVAASTTLDSTWAADIQGTSAVGGTLTAASTTDILSQSNAAAAIANIDSALNLINGVRAKYGAVQNRFDSVISQLQVASENQSAAKSRIMDTDFAATTAALTRSQILQQAGTAMLAQANSLPQGVLSLLR